jgi:thioredoxin 1
VNNKILLSLGVVAILVIVGLGYYYVSNQSQNRDVGMKDTSSTISPADTASGGEQNSESQGDAVTTTGSYVPYTRAALQNAVNTKRVLFFYANWCPTCRPVHSALEAEDAKIPAGVTVIRVNYNDTETDQEEKDLAKKYAVTYQHTFVLLDQNGKEVKKWNGGSLDDIIAMTK